MVCECVCYNYVYVTECMPSVCVCPSALALCKYMCAYVHIKACNIIVSHLIFHPNSHQGMEVVCQGKVNVKEI